MVEDGYEFFARRHLVTLFSAPNYCGEFDNAGAMMSVDDTLMCSFQVSISSLGLALLECCELLIMFRGKYGYYVLNVLYGFNMEKIKEKISPVEYM